MSLYKYTSVDVLVKIITEGKIRLSPPCQFNDPFELLFELYVPENSPENLNISFSNSSPRRNPPIGNLPDNFISDKCNDVNSRKILKQLNDQIGILCLSRSRNNILMWAHYACQYSGVMIEFNEEHEFFSGKIEVEYLEHRPKKSLSALDSTISPIPISELCFKSKDWEYELETRIVRPLSECNKTYNPTGGLIYLMDLPIDSIKSITMGERVSIDNQKNIWALVKETHIMLSLAAVDMWGYGFRMEPIKFDKPYSELNPMITPRTASIFEDLDDDLGKAARWMKSDHQYSNIVNQTL